MKEIIYQSTRKQEIIEEGEYKGVKYAIINQGLFPTAYVENILNVDDYADELIGGVDVHCGFNFCSVPYWKDDESTTYLGWDYGHLGDYIGYYEDEIPSFGDKKWTYEEILAEVHSIIEQLLKIKRKMGLRWKNKWESTMTN